MEYQEKLKLAAKYVWYTPAQQIVDNDIRTLVAQVMELGTWEDAHALLDDVGRDLFISVLNDHPVGLISNKSLAFWHYRLGLAGDPPRKKQRFD